jgi:hypothetical protein
MSRVHLPENLHVVEYSRTVVVNTMDGEEFPLSMHVAAISKYCA